MAAIQKYVDPDATGTGSGDSEVDAYTSLFLAAGDMSGNDYSADDVTITCLSSAGSEDFLAGTVNWTGFVGNPLTMRIEAKVGDEAVTTGYDTGRYRVRRDGALFACPDFGIDFIGLQLASDSTDGLNIIACSSNGDFLIDSCYITCLQEGSTQGVYCTGNGTVNIRNCILQNGGTAGGSEAVLTQTGTPTVNVDNCAVYNWNDGIERDSGTINVTNCAVFGNADDFDGAMTIDYCASDDGDGTNAVTPSNWDDVFEDYLNGDFSLKATDTDLTDAGDELNATFTNSMNGVDRGSANWDIGPWQTVTSSAPIVLTDPTAVNPTSTVVTPRVTSDLAGGSLYAYAVVGSGQTPNHATIKANAQSTSTPVVGVNTMPNITGLTPGTAYTLAFSAETATATPSTPVYVDFSTTALVANVVLRNLSDNSLFASQTGIEYALWDEASLAGIGVPNEQGTGSTDASGVLAIPYGTAVDQNGIVLARKPVAGADNTNDLWAAGGVLAE